MQHLGVWGDLLQLFINLLLCPKFCEGIFAEISLSDCKDGCSRTMFCLGLSPSVGCSELTEVVGSVCGCLPAVVSIDPAGIIHEAA